MSRRRLRWLWVVLGIVGLGGVIYAADLIMSEGTVPRGVTVVGVDIGSMSPDQAEVRLRNQLAEHVKSPVTVQAGGLETTFDPTTSGLSVNWEATVKQAGRQPKNPITRLLSVWKTREVGTVSHFNEQVLGGTISRVSTALSQNPQDATLLINDQGKAVIADDVDGQTAEPDVVESKLRKEWLNTKHQLAVDVKVTPAAVKRSAAEKASREVVEKVTAGDLVFTGRNDVIGVIRPMDMGRVVTFSSDGDHLRTDWNAEAAKDILLSTLGQTEVEFRNANFEVNGADLTVIPSQDGVEIDWAKTLDPLDAKFLDTANRNHEVVYNDQQATYTTEMAQGATFNDVMGAFTTDGFARDSGVNIQQVAAKVNGAIVLPGETFSLNGFTGPRGEAEGYVEAGIIDQGHADRAVGGGISQFATTLYNASYFAGMEDTSHTAHSYYISRYPAGREATVFEGAIDLQFKNTFDTPVLIRTSAGSSTVSVELRGVRHVDVESIPGERTSYTDPQRMELTGDTCSASSGSRGFTTSDTRVIRDLSGRELSRRTTTTKYDPAPIVTCH